MANGLIIAAPRSGSGKTLVTLGLLAALRQRGLSVVPAKTGPDYIDRAILARVAGILDDAGLGEADAPPLMRQREGRPLAAGQGDRHRVLELALEQCRQRRTGRRRGAGAGAPAAPQRLSIGFVGGERIHGADHYPGCIEGPI